MSLRGQGEGGYAMAALLVALAVMAVLMSAALPVWRHDAQREKEEELVFRGQQYVRAIRLYNAKTRSFPPSVDVLIQGHFLRKKYKDPITNDDFDLVGAANPNPQGGSSAAAPGGRGAQATAGGPPISAGGLGGGSGFGGAAAGGLIGVRSKSKDESIRLYLNRNHYNEWTFVYVGGAPGGPGGGLPGRGQPGGPGGNGRGGNGRGGGPGGDGRGGGFPRGGPPGGGFPRGGPPGPGGGAQPPISFPGRGRGGL